MNDTLNVKDRLVVEAINRLTWVTGVGLGLIVITLWWIA